jgi:hypothetical protein
MSSAADAAGGAARPPRRRRSLSGGALRALALAVVAGALLALLTIATFLYQPRYEPEGRGVLANADFRAGFEGWQVEGLVTLDETELGRAMLQNWDPARAVFLRQTIALPAGRTSLRLSADIAVRRVERGAEPWHTARVYLVQQTADGRQLWNEDTALADLIGTTERQHFATVFEVPGTVPEVVLGIELPFAVGYMEIANLELAIVEEQPLFRLLATVLVAGWSLLGCWAVHQVYRGIRSPTVRGWLLATVAMLMLGLFMPALYRQALIDALAGGFGLDLPDPDAFGHAVVFGLLALLVRAGRPRDPLLLHLSCWLLVGALTEVLQLFTPDRDPQAADWLADVAGISAGLALAELGLLVQRRLATARKEQKEQNERTARAVPGRAPFARR